jgi:Galactose-3-O-sulfotransferase
MICFCHMIKTAGTTMHYIFRNNYGFNYVEIRKPNFCASDLKSILKINGNIKAIGGHSLRSTVNLESVCPQIRFITFLRDPVNRYLSHYNHAIRNNFHQMSLEEHCEVLGETNYQTKFITGSMNLTERSYFAAKKDLRQAMKILSEQFAFVGLVEEFDESLLLLKRSMELQDFDIRYKKENVAKTTYITRDMISPTTLQRIKELNQLDCELYEFVRDELFEPQKDKYGSKIYKDLNHLRIANKKFKFRRGKILNFRIGKYLVYRKMNKT